MQDLSFSTLDYDIRAKKVAIVRTEEQEKANAWGWYHHVTVIRSHKEDNDLLHYEEDTFRLNPEQFAAMLALIAVRGDVSNEMIKEAYKITDGLFDTVRGFFPFN